MFLFLQGDRGGPLTLNGQLVGIVSWAVSCASGFPGVFASVAHYFDWMENTVKETTNTKLSLH